MWCSGQPSSNTSTPYIVLQGAQLTKAPSMTLSESQALDSFDFLGAEDTSLLHRISRASFSEGSEGTALALAQLAALIHPVLLVSSQIISALLHLISVRMPHTSLWRRGERTVA